MNIYNLRNENGIEIFKRKISIDKFKSNWNFY